MGMRQGLAKSSALLVAGLSLVGLSGCVESVNSQPHEPGFGHPAEAFFTELPGFGQVAQVRLGANSWAMFNWTIPSQEAGTFWWAVVEAPDPQNVSLAVVTLNSEGGLQKTGELLSTPTFYATDPHEAPEFASRSAFKS